MELLTEQTGVSFLQFLGANMGLILDIVQTLVVAVCVFYGMFLYQRISDKRKYIYLLSAFTCLVVGDTVLYLFLLFQNVWIKSVSASDVAYVGMYLFFITTMLHIRKSWSTRRKLDAKKNFPWAILVATLVGVISIILVYFLYRIGCAKPPRTEFALMQMAFGGLSFYMLISARRGNRKFHLVMFLVFGFDFLSGLFTLLMWPFGQYLFDIALTITIPFLVPAAHGMSRRRHRRKEKGEIKEKLAEKEIVEETEEEQKEIVE